MVKFTIDEPTPLLNVWQRWHWAKRRKYTQELSKAIWIIWSTVSKHFYPDFKTFKKCHVTIERHSAGLPDWDGLYGGLKPLLDCLVVRTDRNPHGLGFIEDDNPNCIMTLTAKPIKCKRKEGKTVVIIEQVE